MTKNWLMQESLWLAIWFYWFNYRPGFGLSSGFSWFYAVLPD